MLFSRYHGQIGSKQIHIKAAVQCTRVRKLNNRYQQRSKLSLNFTFLIRLFRSVVFFEITNLRANYLQLFML